MSKKKLIAFVCVIFQVSITSLAAANVDVVRDENNQTGTITQFLKSQFALVHKMQPIAAASESGNADVNFNNNYKMLLSGDLSSDLDILNDSSELDDPNDDFYKLKFPDKVENSSPKLQFHDNQNIYKVPKSRGMFKKFKLKTLKDSSESSFEYFSHLFDHFMWNLETLNSTKISSMCLEDLQLYLVELRASADWAIKASDSSGRFRGLFFLENDFWLGSKDFCDEINMENMKNRKIPTLHFFVMRILMKFENMKKQRILHVGQCLPDTCNANEIAEILRLDPSAIKFKEKNDFNIFDTRKVPGDVNILRNIKFYIFTFIIFIIIFLIIVATIFERNLRIQGFQLDKKAPRDDDDENNSDRQKHEMDSMNNNNNNNNNNRDESENAKAVNSLKELNQMEKFLLCFSLETNAKTILNCDNDSKDPLSCIHGLRFFTILWTILVHTYLQLFGVGENRFNREASERFFIYQIVGNATFSVDTFFFISGFLVVFLYLKSEKTMTSKEISLPNGLTKITLLVFYRLIRLTPVYLAVIVFTELAMKYIYNGSVFTPGLYDHLTCADHWWRNIFYINNFYPLTEMCLMWSWYLANDFQFYIITIVILIFTSRRFKLTIFIISFLLILALITSMFMSVRHKYQHKVAEPFESFDFLYDKPWQRFGPYAMGTFTAFIYHFNKSPKKISSTHNITLWMLASSGLFLIVFGVPHGQLNVTLTSFYVSFGHALWGVCLMWILLSCFWGLAKPIQNFLSYNGFIPFSRLTYCAYLIHPTIMMMTSYQLQSPIQLMHGMILTTFLGNCILSFLAAFVISLMFEAPVIRLLKVIFKK